LFLGNDVNCEDPYRYFTWRITYGDIYPLGVKQQVEYCTTSFSFCFHGNLLVYLLLIGSERTVLDFGNGRVSLSSLVSNVVNFVELNAAGDLDKRAVSNC
jgi:hypothetical protein